MRRCVGSTAEAGKGEGTTAAGSPSWRSARGTVAGCRGAGSPWECEVNGGFRCC